MKKEIEIQQENITKLIKLAKENITKLIKLAKENPTLKIIPMVDSEVIHNDGFDYWSGVWSSAEIDEIWCEDERIYFKSLDIEELVEDYMDKYDEGYPTNEEEIERWANEQVNNLKWEKVIVVRIRAM